MNASSDSEILLTLVLVALSIGLLLVLTPSPQQRSSWQERTIDAPAGEVLTAAISHLQDLGYPIDTIDRESGFVKTQYAGRGQLQGGAGLILDILVGEARYAATVQVRTEGAGVSRVRINLIAEQWSEGSLFRTGHWSQDPLAYSKADYDRFFTELRAKLGLVGMFMERKSLEAILLS